MREENVPAVIRRRAARPVSEKFAAIIWRRTAGAVSHQRATIIRGRTARFASNVLIWSSSDPLLPLVIPAKAGIHGGVDPGFRRDDNEGIQG